MLSETLKLYPRKPVPGTVISRKTLLFQRYLYIDSLQNLLAVYAEDHSLNIFYYLMLYWSICPGAFLEDLLQKVSQIVLFCHFLQEHFLY